MKVIFTGTGEAFDEHLPNCSVWIEAHGNEGKKSLLLDCGFCAPFSYWRNVKNPLDLDGLWISHFHGDHFFGTPALLLRFWEEGRTKPLTVLGQTGVQEKIFQAMDMAYPGFRRKMAFAVNFIEVSANKNISALGLDFGFAETEHSQTNLAVRVDDNAASVFYSGDGRPTDATLDLAQGCDLIIHEAFRIEPDTPGHGTVQGALDFARKAGANTLALVHVQRDVRRGRHDEIMKLLQETKDLKAVLPKPGDMLEIGAPG
ncbi:MAG: ribonuclease Z [Thermodesulfobacteriota bacterium]|nr:ribonuclease Z [Thermodesulfobacteriota bacterium]